MKTILAGMIFIATMASVSVSFAEDMAEPDDSGQVSAQENIQESDQAPDLTYGQGSDPGSAEGSELYMNEIKTNCEAEAAGLPEEDARAYIKECIDNMKQSFSGQ